MTSSNKREKIVNTLKEKTNNAPDIKYKDFIINKQNVTFIYSMSVSSSTSINDFILRRLDEEKGKIKDENIYEYIKNFIPNNNIIPFDKKEDISYYVMSGFTVAVFDDGRLLAFENRASIYGSISKSENERGLKGPSDAFSENYQFNMGMIRRRVKTEDLWIDEKTIGTKSKTKVAMFYIKGLTSEETIRNINEKLDKINIDYVGNTNYILEAMSNTNRFILPTNLSTERPDFAAQMLMQGRIVLIVENSNEAIILPCLFLDFFKNPEDYYEKGLNVIISRTVRFVAFFLTVFTPALYISLMAFNWESLPSGLLISFSVQREGVPFSSIFEILVMSLMFQILRESDLRFPGKGGSSISIVGALVLGQAAVEAGVVSPITIIIVGIASVSSLAFSSIDLINACRWWQLFLIIMAWMFGFVGVLFGSLIILATLVSQSSCGVPYFSPFEPFSLKEQPNVIIPTKKEKFHPKNIFKKDGRKEK